MSDTGERLDCAEYVLGTLTLEERQSLEQEMMSDPSLRLEVVRWEDWLAGLNDVIPSMAPAPGLWPAIERRLRAGAAPVAANDSALSSDVVTPIRQSRARWRASTIVFGLLAAGLALFIGRERLQPPTAVSYLAVVNRGGDLPALIVRVDTGTDTVSVRSVAAETPPNRVLQLWYIAGGQAPRSLGLLDRPQTSAALPPNARADDVAGATLAVSVEPPGGSPTGAPTGQVVYSGKLIRDQ